VSVTDHPAWFYQQRDITDPTPYEEDNRILPDECCALCGEDFFKGQRVILIDTPDHYYRLLIHEDCYNPLFRSVKERTRFEEIMDRLGFETGDAEE
jgi:hypothetical protein